jgi:nitrile hydratase accessory protein
MSTTRRDAGARSRLLGRLAAEHSGPAAPPRKNGELVFADPWQSRVFGIAVALCEKGLYQWDDFRRCLIAEIAAWEREHPEAESNQYYERWLAALERLLTERGFCASTDIDLRAAAQHD